MSENVIFKFAKTLGDSIVTLRGGGHNLAALMLIYTAIDQMAWLSVEADKHGPKDFEAWVNNYMLSRRPLDCTAEELWLARNGMLHMGTAEAAGHAKNPSLRKIAYVFGAAELTANEPQKWVVIRFEDLFQSFMEGTLWFQSDIEGKPDKIEVAERKTLKMLRDVGGS